VDFLLLGPLVVIGPRGEPVPVDWPARRALLAVLMLYAGQPCSHDVLIEALWGARPPKEPVLSLRSHISLLRREVGLGNRLKALNGEHVKAPSDSAAYQLRVSEEELDLLRFRQRSARGRQLLASGDLEAAAPDLGAAVGCWREPPLQNLPSSPRIDADAAALLEERHRVEADYVDVMLALGRPQEVLASLKRTTTIDPLAEDPAAQFMRALYQAGRKNEALEAFSRARGAMIQAFGTDPSPRLDSLRVQILHDSPTLTDPLRPAAPALTRGGPATLVRTPPPGPARHIPQ
jgi:DNA-binding SARP family transcriptional activator